ncbi:Fosmidomycin resistance protein [Sporomusa ovata DSM 2662]|uniref:Fosmidomycin resistance protein n=1 Tax=Sporomusa ovata TaxID=2378 RepID=A0A0U1L5S3_9FIRM|nr:MFS transporter [Sporomusa ovata]EQB26064.1 major facilitator superfamily MFS_1 [Sporomusa ovata DSM 2662]CQR74639.1 Fosmidomycin resistance protein [Sporomusa ovata]
MNMTSPNKEKVVSLSLAHLLNDWYMNYIQTLLPFLVTAGLGVSKGAFLISAFTITSSLLQPVFGYLVDQKNQRWMVYVGTIWMAVLISLVGLLKNYPLLVIVAALSGVGTAAFHPQASAMVTAVSGNRKGFFQACFTAAGNVGWALTPLVVVPFVQAYGLDMTPLFILQGVLVAILLWFSAPRISSEVKVAPPSLIPILRSNWVELTKLVLVVAFRSLAYFGLIAFLPLYLQTTNISLLAGSRLLFVMLFSGAMGGIVGGYLSDRIGRKAVIVGSLVISSPMFYFFLNTNGFLSYVLLALAGAALLASFSVTVVVAQETISKNAAMASGLMLGFGIGIGGLGVGLVGMIAEHQGIVFAINLLIWLPLLAGLFGLGMNVKKHTI